MLFESGGPSGRGNLEDQAPMGKPWGRRLRRKARNPSSNALRSSASRAISREIPT